jgi:hypothetical protein
MEESPVVDVAPEVATPSETEALAESSNEEPQPASAAEPIAEETVTVDPPADRPAVAVPLVLNRPPPVLERQRTDLSHSNPESLEEGVAAAVAHSTRSNNEEAMQHPASPTTTRGRHMHRDLAAAAPPLPSTAEPRLALPTKCLNPATDINARLDTQVEVRVYPCNNSQNNPPNTPNSKKKFTSFTIKPEGVIIQGSNRQAAAARGGSPPTDLGTEYAMHVGRKLPRFELADTRACQLLVTTHAKSFWVVPAPEAFSRHSGTCRLLGDRKHPPAPHVLRVGDFLRVGSVGVVVIETHNGQVNQVLSEEKISKIMKDTTTCQNQAFDHGDGETDGGMLPVPAHLTNCFMYSRSFFHRQLGRLHGRG